MNNLLVQVTAAIPILVTVLSAGYAQAATFTEIDDAGETLSTAAVIPRGSQPLTSISGTLSGGADLFRVFLKGGQSFSATTINPDTLELPVDKLLDRPTALLEDSQLFLFDSRGRGIYGNDDSFGTTQSTLLSDGFSPSRSGNYLLAISSFGFDPASDAGKIFADNNFDQVLEPTGPGGGSSLSGFTGSSTTDGRYTIALTGAKTVPEPSSVLGTLALGALGIGSLLKHKKKAGKGLEIGGLKK